MKRLLFYFLVVVVPAGFLQAEERTFISRDENRPAARHTVLPPLQTENYEYYDLCGCCEKDLQCEMAEKAITWKDGTKYDSVTSWKVKWDYAYNRDSAVCRADSFRVAIDILFRLPKWTCRVPDSPLLTAKWNAYIKKLTEHENGHRDKALAAASDFTRAVAEMPPALTCGDLDSQVQALSRERMKKLDEEQSIYDAATDHGHAHGMTFP